MISIVPFIQCFQSEDGGNISVIGLAVVLWVGLVKSCRFFFAVGAWAVRIEVTDWR